MTKYHFNPETGKSGPCTAEIKECPLVSQYADGQVAHFETKKDCDAFGEKVIAAQHEFEANKTLQKPKQSTGNTVYPPGLSEDKPISDSSKKNLLTVRESSIKSEAMGRTGDIMKLRGMVATQYNFNAAEQDALHNMALEQADALYRDANISPYSTMTLYYQPNTATKTGNNKSFESLRNIQRKRIAKIADTGSSASLALSSQYNESAKKGENYYVKPCGDGVDAIMKATKDGNTTNVRPYKVIDNITNTVYSPGGDGVVTFYNKEKVAYDPTTKEPHLERKTRW